MSLPPQEIIDEWKREFGKVFSASIFGVDYVFRAVTFLEYDTAERMESSADAEDYLLDCGLLHPRDMDLDRIPAGAVTALIEEVLEVSGFGDPKRAKAILEEERQRVSEVWGLMKSFVIAAMPAYKEEDLNSLSFDQMAHKVALAEQIIQVNQAAFGIDNELKLDLIDPEEEAMRAEEEARKHAAQKKPGQAGYNDPIAQKLQEALGG